MELTAPAGYGEIEPFDRERHRGCGVREGLGYRFAAGMMAVPVAAAEFFAAARGYPVVFVAHSSAPSAGYLPVAMVGFREGENLFVDAEGAWEPGAYVPAFLRRYPFCVVDVRRGGSAPLEHLVCVERAALEEGSPRPLVDGEGRETPKGREVMRLIREMEEARVATEALCAELAREGLLVPFEAKAALSGGEGFRLGNLYRVDEETLNRLPGERVKALMEKGWLSRVYAHLMSLDNFAGLLDRAASRR